MEGGEGVKKNNLQGEEYIVGVTLNGFKKMGQHGEILWGGQHGGILRGGQHGGILIEGGQHGEKVWGRTTWEIIEGGWGNFEGAGGLLRGGQHGEY